MLIVNGATRYAGPATIKEVVMPALLKVTFKAGTVLVPVKSVSPLAVTRRTYLTKFVDDANLSVNRSRYKGAFSSTGFVQSESRTITHYKSPTTRVQFVLKSGDVSSTCLLSSQTRWGYGVFKRSDVNFWKIYPQRGQGDAKSDASWVPMWLPRSSGVVRSATTKLRAATEDSLFVVKPFGTALLVRCEPQIAKSGYDFAMGTQTPAGDILYTAVGQDKLDLGRPLKRARLRLNIYGGAQYNNYRLYSQKLAFVAGTPEAPVNKTIGVYDFVQYYTSTYSGTVYFLGSVYTPLGETGVLSGVVDVILRYDEVADAVFCSVMRGATVVQAEGKVAAGKLLSLTPSVGFVFSTITELEITEL